MKSIIFFTLPLLMISCASKNHSRASYGCPQTIMSRIGLMRDSNFQQCVDHKRKKRESEEKCNKNPACLAEKKRQEDLKNYKETYPVCAELLNPEYKTKFFSVVCSVTEDQFKSWPKPQQDECLNSYRETFIAKLIETYPNADEKMLSKWCKANPFECRSWERVEEKVSQLDEEASEQERQRQDEAEAKLRREAFAQALQNMGKSLQQPQRQRVNCTSTKIGNTVHTDCN